MLLPEKQVWNDRRLVRALGLLCLALVALAGCNANNAAGNGSSSGRAIPAAPAGFSTFKSANFSLAYPDGWTQQKPENGDGVQYMGPDNQVFVAASLGAIQITPAALDKAFCSLAGFGGAPSGASNTVKIDGATWVREECGDTRGSKAAIVESTVHNKQVYYIVYGSQLASLESNRAHYFNTMEQSFTFAA